MHFELVLGWILVFAMHPPEAGPAGEQFPHSTQNQGLEPTPGSPPPSLVDSEVLRQLVKAHPQ